MKAFDLERAKAGDPVMTRDGKDVRVICFDRNYGEYQILALLKEDDGREVDTYAYNNEGIWIHDNGVESNKTLVMKPKKNYIQPFKSSEIVFETYISQIKTIPEQEIFNDKLVDFIMDSFKRDISL